MSKAKTKLGRNPFSRSKSRTSKPKQKTSSLDLKSLAITLLKKGPTAALKQARRCVLDKLR